MAFLAAMLGTRVVSDAAQAALAALAVEDSGALDQLRALSQQEVARAQGVSAAEGSASQSEQPAASKEGSDTKAGPGSKEGLAPAPEADLGWGPLRNRAACAAAFAAAAVKAKLLAEAEEHHMRSLLTKAVEWQVRAHPILRLQRPATGGALGASLCFPVGLVYPKQLGGCPRGVQLF